MNYLKKLIAIFLINLSKVIYYAIPKELLDFSALFQGISHNTNEHKQQLKVLKKKN